MIDESKKNHCPICDNELQKDLDGVITCYSCGYLIDAPINRGSEYIDWLDTKPEVFLTFREWMFSYHPKEWEVL